MITPQFSFQNLRNVEHHQFVMYDIQNYFTEIWAVQDCNLRLLIWAKEEENENLFIHIFIEKVFCMIAIVMMKI